MQIEVYYRDYPNFKIEFWGSAPKSGVNVVAGFRESLIGKHIKDRSTQIRSLIFPDRTKLTMTSASLEGQMLNASTYEGTSVHHFNLTCNTLEYSSLNSKFTVQLDQREQDGETGTFEITVDGLLFYNVYTEMEARKKIEKRVPLGKLYKTIPFKWMTL